ncbi:MAG: hypothetical protein J0M02_02585 [Planctomycetes bacterium]|nr:hypothetical protein [Planctomycetota bacterium]
MTRRRRTIIVILAVLAGIPLLAAIGVGGYLRSGGLERQVEHVWEQRGLPGRLRVGSVRLDGFDRAVAENVSIGEDGEPPLVAAKRVVVAFDLVDRRPTSIRVEGGHGALDAARYRLLRGIIRAEARNPPTRAPQTVRVEVVDGTVDLPGGTQATGVSVQVSATGPVATATGEAMLAGRRLRVAVSTDRASPDAPIITTVQLLEAGAPASAALAALAGMELIRPLPQEFTAVLPGMVDVSGSSVQVDAESETVRGEVRAAWAGGSASCLVDSDARRVNLRRLVLRDERFGAIEGTLVADRSGERLALDASSWQAGGGLPIPANLPLADIGKLLPELQVRWPTSEGRCTVALVGPGRARLEAVVGGGAPVRIAASELPLVMVQGLLPKPLVLGGGHLVSATATLAEGRPEFAGEVRQARLLAEGWSFGPLDGQVAAVSQPGGGVQVSAKLPIGPGDGTAIAYSGGAAGGRLQIDCPAIEALLGRVRGPVRMPDLTGRISLTAEYEFSEQAVLVRIPGFDLSDCVLRLVGREIATAISTRLSGSASIAKDRIEVDLGGQLRSGAVRIPDEWLPLAAKSPIFSLDLVAELRDGQLAELNLRRAMIRAADASGEPVAAGYSAQLEGKLAGERLAGRLVGIVDHADLAWITSRVVPGHVAVEGEGAVAFQATIDGGEPKRIDGTFLPLGADLDVERGKLRVGGITGGVRFSIGQGGGK